jgi:hypothetical protein
MSIVINGSGSISGISAGGLPDGVVTTDDLASTLDLSGKTVTLPSGTGGKVLQVVSAVYDTAVTVNSGSPTSTGLSASITPSSTSNKVLVLISQYMSAVGGSNDYCGGNVWVRRNGTNIFVSDFGGYLSTSVAQRQLYSVVSYSQLDSPSSTSSVTYDTYIYDSGDSTVSSAKGRICLIEVTP